MSANNEFRRKLLRVLRTQFRLEWVGIHGVPHWARVRWNALAMARVNGARENVVELFAFLHDSWRFSDVRDREHGARAADFTLQLNSELLKLDRPGLERRPIGGGPLVFVRQSRFVGDTD